MSVYEIFLPISIFGSIAVIIKIISDNVIRSKLIQKGLVDENIKYLFDKKYSSHPTNNLKWGFILIGIGLPLLLRQMFPDLFSDEGMIGLMFILAGVGFIVYYNIAKKESQKNEVEE